MNKEEFCYPSDFYWIDKDMIKKTWKTMKFRTVLYLIIYFLIATLCMIGYYIFFPFTYIWKKCEYWCFR